MSHDDEKERASALSRRDFLRVGAASAITTGLSPGALLAPDAAAAASSSSVIGPGAVPVVLSVNGVERRLSLEPRVTLLEALRNQLDLTGAKSVCDRGTCGACTVLVDGKSAYACSLLAIEAQGRRVETVESLGTPESLHPLQAAFVENDAQQCGACTPGFVMACKHLLSKTPRPTPEQVADGLGGNFCRCGTYDGIKRALASVTGGAHA